MEGLHHLKDLLNDKIQILGGDFNVIVTLDEKQGGIQRLDKDIKSFSNLIIDLQLIDLAPTNDIFT